MMITNVIIGQCSPAQLVVNGQKGFQHSLWCVALPVQSINIISISTIIRIISIIKIIIIKLS